MRHRRCQFVGHVDSDAASGSGAAPPFADGSELNSPFTAGAVQQAIGALRGGKATVGLLKLDALSVAAAQLAPCLASVFNACQRVAALPRGWALCGITPIHKGGDTSDPGNYRGIAVGSLLAKLDSGKGSANSDGKGPLTGRLFVYCVFQRLIYTNHGGQIAEATTCIGWGGLVPHGTRPETSATARDRTRSLNGVQ